MKIIVFVLAVCVSVINSSAYASEPGVWFDVPAYEYPFNHTTTHPPDYFSMRQSVRLSTSYYQTAHRLIGGDNTDPDGVFWRYALLAGFDYVTTTVPIGMGWMHEEWHRSVMTNRKIDSFNEVNAWPWGAGTVAVDDVDDADLIKLKAEHPADMVRLSAAGMESQIYQNIVVEESHFFRGARSRDLTLLWLNNLNVTSYISTCASTDADTETDKQMAEEGANVKARDFTGMDCTAWVYDLFRPDEPYTARGTHPSGVGIKRYIKWSDLTSEEQDYLQLQQKLALLNFVDPFLFGFTSFEHGGLKWNFKLSHYLTSFGSTVDGNLFLEGHGHKFLATLHNGMTPKRYFPGVSLKWYRAELAHRMHFTIGGTVWVQPKDQRYDAEDGDILVDGNVEIAFLGSDDFEFYVGYEQKNDGWIAGNVYLEDNWSVWGGFRVGLF